MTRGDDVSVIARDLKGRPTRVANHLRDRGEAERLASLWRLEPETSVEILEPHPDAILRGTGGAR
jgi:hypothetical protein